MKQARATFSLPTFDGSIDILVGLVKSQGWTVKPRGQIPLTYDIFSEGEEVHPAGEIDHLEATASNPELLAYFAVVGIGPGFVKEGYMDRGIWVSKYSAGNESRNIIESTMQPEAVIGTLLAHMGMTERTKNKVGSHYKHNSGDFAASLSDGLTDVVGCDSASRVTVLLDCDGEHELGFDFNSGIRLGGETIMRPEGATFLIGYNISDGTAGREAFDKRMPTEDEMTLLNKLSMYAK